MTLCKRGNVAVFSFLAFLNLKMFKVYFTAIFFVLNEMMNCGNTNEMSM